MLIVRSSITWLFGEPASVFGVLIKLLLIKVEFGFSSNCEMVQLKFVECG